MARIDLGTRPDGSRDRQTRSFATRDEAEVWCCELDRFANAKLKEGLAPSTVNRPRVGRFTCQCPRRVPRSLRSRAERRHIPPRQLPPPAIAPLRERVLARVDRRVGDVVAAAHMAWGAANDCRLLAAMCGQPVLAALLTRIAAKKRGTSASAYCRRSGVWLRAVPLPSSCHGSCARRGRRSTWGSATSHRSSFGGVLASLGSDAAAVERRIGRFTARPGFGGLGIYRDAVSVPTYGPLRCGRHDDARSACVEHCGPS